MASGRECVYLITFINREMADEWWRMISTSSGSYSGIVERASPRLYIQSVSSLSPIFTSNHFPNADHFHKKMLIMSLDGKEFSCISSRTSKSSNIVRIKSPVALPPVAITDHISGGWYFIRSKADPFSNWYLRTSGACVVCGDASCDAIHVSSEYRTRLCVRVRNLAEVPENFVMIGKDEISIAAPKGYILHIDDTGDLKATKDYQGETDLLFADLKKRFVTRAEKQVNGEVWEYVESVERGIGEPWELVE